MAVGNVKRRDVLAGGAAALCALTLTRNVHATPESMAEAIKKATGGAAMKKGRLKLDMPLLAESGNAVPLTVTVESPMTAADHVKTVYIFSERNPNAEVARFHLGPRSGKAAVSTRIRLASSQTIVAVAQLSDGSFWQDRIKILVTLGACVEGE